MFIWSAFVCVCGGGGILKHYKFLTKPTDYKVDHNITDFDLKQKSTWKFDKRIQYCVLKALNKRKKILLLGNKN